MTAVRSKSPPEEFFEVTVDAWTEPFWKATGEGRLVAPQCADCQQFRMPPTPFCPHCQSQAIDWITLSGCGTIYSYTVVSRAISPGMESSIPYVPAVISLPDAEGVRLISNIIDAPLDQINVGGSVHVVWNKRPGGYAIPQFVLSSRKPPPNTSETT